MAYPLDGEGEFGLLVRLQFVRARRQAGRVPARVCVRSTRRVVVLALLFVSACALSRWVSGHPTSPTQSRPGAMHAEIV